jgi:hypothetical protein
MCERTVEQYLLDIFCRRLMAAGCSAQQSLSRPPMSIMPWSARLWKSETQSPVATPKDDSCRSTGLPVKIKVRSRCRKYANEHLW